MLNEHNWFANGGGICSGSRDTEDSQNVAILSGYIVLFQWIAITDDDGGLNGVEMINMRITQFNPIKYLLWHSGWTLVFSGSHSIPVLANRNWVNPEWGNGCRRVIHKRLPKWPQVKLLTISFFTNIQL